jgi:hypothetical protein
MLQTALKYNVEVTQMRRVEFPVLFSAGAPLTFFVISEQPANNFNDLLAVFQSRLLG